MQELNLNGIWEFGFFEKKYLEDIPAAAGELSGQMSVPGCFDALPDHYCKRGCAVYRRTFRLEQDQTAVWLRIEGMGLRCRAFLDGRETGFSALPYSTLEFAAGPLGAGLHTLEIQVDNNFDPQKMKLFLPYYDFYAFGGLYHGVSLRFSSVENALDRVLVRTEDYRSGKLSLEFVFKKETPAEKTVRLSINEEHPQTYIIRNGKLTLERPDLALWSPESPALHHLRAECDGCVQEETFGIREIRTDGTRILLNGQPVYLKGFNRHESHPGCGAATGLQEMLEDLQHLRSLNANFIRGCHYPQTREFLDLCDRMGILVWEESLGWGNLPEQMNDPEFIALQKEQTRLMVRNSFNHPCVIIFAFLNENYSGTDAGVALCLELADTIRAENSGRPVTFACSHNAVDRACEFMDIVSFNTYPGWISEHSELDPMEEIRPDLKKILKRFRSLYGNDKPIIVSEMGCCGLYGQHDPAGAQWSEEFQAEYLRNVIDAVFESPDITGLTLWQFNDAKSYHRNGSVIRVKPLAQNLAGVFDIYRRPKLAAAAVAEKFAKKR